MAIDRTWIKQVRAIAKLAERDNLEVEGIEVELPKAAARGKQVHRDWQRRILPDIVPDSAIADAPERTPFRILYALTSMQKSNGSIDDVFTGELSKLEGLFRRESKGKRKMTLAFHVLAVEGAATAERNAKGFTERTFLLLCRKEDGQLDHELVQAVVEQFRLPPSSLDLAQQAVLEELSPGWTSEAKPSYNDDNYSERVVPFDIEAATLFKRDLRSLLAAGLGPADFFGSLNLLLVFHLGLYQPRVAALLNPQMDILFRDMAQPLPGNMEDLERFIGRAQRAHPFCGKVACRAPDAGMLRRVTKHSPSLQTYYQIGRELTVFHFNVLILARLRQLGQAYLAKQWGYNDKWRTDRRCGEYLELQAATRGPREFMQRMREDPDYRIFLERALEALAVRFVQEQLGGSASAIHDKVESAESGLHALRSLYEMYNRDTVANATMTRAYRQGMQVTSSLLTHNQDGLIQARRGLGKYFELGVGLLPLILLTTVGAGAEKIPVSQFWAELERYGLTFDMEERARLLERLRSMGVYERYSDAGEAAYVRNLMLSRSA
ncbi:MAG: DNA phosphorothioation-dependent restriction protein DptG [Enhygromyxa sp.]